LPFEKVIEIKIIFNVIVNIERKDSQELRNVVKKISMSKLKFSTLN